MVNRLREGSRALLRWLAARRAPPQPGRFALRQKSSLHGFIGVAAAPPWREYLLYLPRGMERLARAPLVVWLHGCRQDSEALALHAPGLVRAVAIHSGAPCGAAHDAAEAHRVMAEGPNGDAFPAMRGRAPALIIHGKDDRTVAPVNALYLARQFLVFNGFDPAALPPGAALPRPGMLPLPWRSNGPGGDYYVGARLAARVVTIEGLGHAWSGGDAAHPFFAAEHRDATALVCDFFAAH